MRIRQLWRFPVKSLQGEQIDSIEVDAHGLVGDRRYAIFDLDTGFGLTARRVPELLLAAASTQTDGSVSLTLPDGSAASDDEDLSRWLGRRVTLRSATEAGPRRYENPDDFEHETSSRWQAWDGSPRAFHDSRRTAVSLVSEATVGDWPLRRFRTNVILDGSGEDALVGSRISLGHALLDVGKQVDRCVMVTRPQPDGIERDLDVLRTIHRERDGYLAVGALVAQPGAVQVGDLLRIDRPISAGHT